MGQANEKRLVAHIQRLAKAGFAPDRQTVRHLAYQFAEKLGIKHKFSHITKMAGYAWLSSFLERNPEISVRQAEGLSVARAQGMSRPEADGFFKLLRQVMEEENLMDKPQNIFNMDESGIQLTNKPGKVLTTKGAKDVHVLTPHERGENITVVACCNAEGVFLPPVLLMKGVNKKKEFVDGLPHGSDVYMNPKSSFINAELFLKWFEEHFLPRKPPGKTILILDGHASHYNAFDMLSLADKNGVIILCLPSHTTQALQPLDRSFFGPLKIYYNNEAKVWMQHHKDRNITRYQAGYLIGKAWEKAASVGNAVSGFKATGIFPLNPEIIPEHFFAISDASASTPETITTSLSSDCPVASACTSHSSVLSTVTPSTSRALSPTPSGSSSFALTTSQPESGPLHTPTKYLHEVSPVPTLPVSHSKRRKQSAAVLTSSEHILKCKDAKDKKQKKLERQLNTSKCKSNVTKKKSTEVEEPRAEINETLATSADDVDTNDCVECWENYYTTKEKADWIRCKLCHKWLHESCTMYGSMCNTCGRELKRQEVNNIKNIK